MRLNNSRTAEMKDRSAAMLKKSAEEASTRVVGKGAFRPKDLELFEASPEAVQSCFRGYDKITINPDHGELPAWNVKQSTIDRLNRGF